ncbi:hypothetical protein B0H10DRAFT_2240986 [Mycena sp. CBHHK59/15]|nr:hypothetical protein B0H10DRAFT_2240986 [Mycena sp. CBHHK59/15]
MAGLLRIQWARGWPPQLPYGGHQGQDDHNSQQDGNSQHAGQYHLVEVAPSSTSNRQGHDRPQLVTAVTAVNSAMGHKKNKYKNPAWRSPVDG